MHLILSWVLLCATICSLSTIEAFSTNSGMEYVVCCDRTVLSNTFLSHSKPRAYDCSNARSELSNVYRSLLALGFDPIVTSITSTKVGSPLSSPVTVLNLLLSTVVGRFKRYIKGRDRCQSQHTTCPSRGHWMAGIPSQYGDFHLCGHGDHDTPFKSTVGDEFTAPLL